MKIYILAQGERVWRAVENEWKHPLDDNNKAKGRADWSEEELKEFNYNSKAMNAIYGACYECKGYGHIQSECPNYLRRKNKTYVTTLSDDSDSEEENNTNFVAFFTNHEDDDESKEDMQDLLNSYTQLHAKWEEIIKVNLNLMQENHFLKSEKEKEILLHKETQEKLMKSLEEGDTLLQEIRRLTESAVQPDLATRKDSAVENREVLQHHFQHHWDTSRHTATKDKMISITESGQSKNKNQPKKSGKKGLKRGAYRGIPKLDIDENRKDDACLENKMTRSSHKRTPGVHTSRIMDLLHMDLFRPTQTESKVVRTPVPTTERISKDPEGKKVEQTLYRSMIGGLLYSTASIPDLSFGVGICARYQANPMETNSILTF
nr:histone H2B.V2-like [Ipomoea batatas]